MSGVEYPTFIETQPNEVDLLIGQIKELRSELISIQSSFLSMISVSLGAYGLIIYYAFKLDESCKPNYLFIILPFLYLISFNNIIKYTAKMLGIGSYIRYLEGTINNYYQKPLFQWHSYLVYANGYGAIGGFAQLPCFAALLFLIGYKFVENIRIEFWGKPVFTVLIFLESVFSVISLVVCMTQSPSVEYWCNEIANGYVPEKTRLFKTRKPRWLKIIHALKAAHNKAAEFESKNSQDAVQSSTTITQEDRRKT